MERIRKLFIKLNQWLHTFSRNPKLFKKPNRHAPSSCIKFNLNEVIIGGYQEYTAHIDSITPSEDSYDLVRKFELLSPIFNNENLNGKSFLDLGSSGGFFSIYAHQQGAKVDAVDLDDNYTSIITQAATHLHLNRLEVHTINISEWTQRADIVNAMALIHWIFSCTAIMGNMDNMIQYFRNLTNQILIIEWIDNNDDAIKYFNHLEYNNRFSNDTYNRDSFISSLHKYFNSVDSLGFTKKPTRELFIARV